MALFGILPDDQPFFSVNLPAAEHLRRCDPTRLSKATLNGVVAIAKCPKCGKSLTECASWPAWGAWLCVVVHQVYDCTPVDDLINDLEQSTAQSKNISKESEEKAKSLASVFESKLRVKAASADRLNENTLKQLSLYLAMEIECGQDAQKIKELLQRQLRVYV